MILKKLAPNRHEVNLIKSLVDEAVGKGKKPSVKGIATVMNMHEKAVGNWVAHFTKGKPAPKAAAKVAKPGAPPVKE